MIADQPATNQRLEHVEGYNPLPTELRARQAPRTDRKAAYRLNQRIIPLDGGSMLLRLRNTLNLAVDPQTMQFEVEGWNIHLPVDQAADVPRQIARRFVELFSKADAGILSDKEEQDWLRVLDEVDFAQFSIDRSAPHYLEGTLLRHTPVCRVEWHDGETTNLEPEVAMALHWMEPNQRFGAFAKLGKDNVVKSLERVTLIFEPEQIGDGLHG
jgi:hypothetical protein